MNTPRSGCYRETEIAVGWLLLVASVTETHLVDRRPGARYTVVIGTTVSDYYVNDRQRRRR